MIKNVQLLDYTDHDSIYISLKLPKLITKA